MFINTNHFVFKQFPYKVSIDFQSQVACLIVNKFFYLVNCFERYLLQRLMRIDSDKALRAGLSVDQS